MSDYLSVSPNVRLVVCLGCDWELKTNREHATTDEQGIRQLGRDKYFPTVNKIRGFLSQCFANQLLPSCWPSVCLYVSLSSVYVSVCVYHSVCLSLAHFLPLCLCVSVSLSFSLSLSLSHANTRTHKQTHTKTHTHISTHKNTHINTPINTHINIHINTRK